MSNEIELEELTHEEFLNKRIGDYFEFWGKYAIDPKTGSGKRVFLSDLGVEISDEVTAITIGNWSMFVNTLEDYPETDKGEYLTFVSPDNTTCMCGDKEYPIEDVKITDARWNDLFSDG